MTSEIEPLKRVLLRIDEAATLLGVGRVTVYRMVNRGELKAVRLGGGERGKMRIPVAEIERLGEEGK